jgi:hypothetical protein
MFATRSLSKTVAADEGSAAGRSLMNHPRLIPQARRIKQIVLWMGIIRRPALRDKIKVDRWRLNV